MLTVLVGTVNLGEWRLKMRLTEISCNSHLHSEQQTVFILGVRKSHMSKVTVAHKDKLHVAQEGFSTEAYK